MSAATKRALQEFLKPTPPESKRYIVSPVFRGGPAVTPLDGFLEGKWVVRDLKHSSCTIAWFTSVGAAQVFADAMNEKYSDAL